MPDKTPNERSGEDSERPLWHGRFAEGPADALMALSVSIDFDQRLAGDDLHGSRAHVDMLAAVGLLTEAERFAIAEALDQVERELNEGSFRFVPTDEDIHTAVERRVTEIAGDAGAKLHTGRSRNDQVALDLRMWVRREAREVVARIHDLQSVLLRRAEECDEDAYLPGYTHLQRAQPVLLAHHLLAHVWALARDVDRWRLVRQRADVSPLGAGALAGSSLPLDPESVARALGFSQYFENSLDAVSDRDFVAEALFASALAQVHLSRIGEEIVLWSSEEFGFLRLPDAFATGSSMLPQKKNPDIAELARGKAGRLIGNLTGFLATLEGSAALVQPGPAGGQGTALRRGRHADPLGARAERTARRSGLRYRAHARRGRRACVRRHRPRRAPGGGRHAVPRRARARRRAGAAVARAARSARGAGHGRAPPR